MSDEFILTTPFNSGLNSSDSLKSNNWNKPITFGLSQTEKINPYQGTGKIYTTYNHQTYAVELYLDSGIGQNDKQKMPIHPNAIQELYIEDFLLDWSTKGYIIVTLPNIEKLNPSTTILGQPLLNANLLEKNTLENYIFRADGYDVLRVCISLISQHPLYEEKIEENDPAWTLSYLFSIYRIDDLIIEPNAVNEAATLLRTYKLSFKDLRQHILETTNMEFSTVDYSDDDKRSTTNSNQGLIPTDQAIKEIIKQAFRLSSFNLDLISSINENLWDKGKSSIFYTSPATSSAYDDLMYVYRHHVSSKNNDYSILTTTRSKNGYINELALIPLRDFFEKAGNSSTQPGELQVEHFFLNTFTNQNDQNNFQRSIKAPLGFENKSNIDVATAKYGSITSFSFLDIIPDVNALFFRNNPVYSYDFSNRQFNVEFSKNTVTEARDYIVKEYISNLYKKGPAGPELFSITLNKFKENLNLYPKFSLYGDNEDLRIKEGLHHLLNIGVFQNLGICFTTLGIPLRRSGTFIAIDSTFGSLEDDYCNKLYGQWFVVKVEHIFKSNIYFNNIYAIKIHRFDTPEKRFIGSI